MRVANSLKVLLNPCFKLNEGLIAPLKADEINRLAGYAYFLVLGSEQWDFVIDSTIEPPTLREIRELLYSAARNPRTMGLKYELLFPWESRIVDLYTDNVLISDGATPEDMKVPHYVYRTAGRHSWPEETAEQYGERLLSMCFVSAYVIPQISDRPVIFVQNEKG